MPFRYPAKSSRRHGPRGYATCESFRPWLRDEFSFRCGYCLMREQWGKVRGTFDLEHFVPISHDPARRLDYDNLVYACASCNAAKQDKCISAPLEALSADDIQVFDDGRIEGRSPAAREIIQAIGLDSEANMEFRRTWIEIIALARQHDAQLYERLMGWPDDLPNLSRLRPPGGNHGRKESPSRTSRGGSGENWSIRIETPQLILLLRCCRFVSNRSNYTRRDDAMSVIVRFRQRK